MISKSLKIVIVGAGAVGASTAFNLCIQGLCDEIVLIDLNYEKAYVEALDIQQSMAYQNRAVKVQAGTYKDCGDADIVVITAAVPYVMGQTRLDLFESSSKIIKSIVPPVMESGFNGHFIVITNPVDIMSYYVYKLSGLPKNQVLGTGTMLDSARLRGVIAGLMRVSPKSVEAYTMGEHGDSQFIPWSNVSVGGKSFREILEDNKETLGNVDLEKIAQDIRIAGFTIGRIKGTTNYAIASTAVEIIRTILNDENKVYPVSIYLDGDYGVKDVFAGVPVVLNRQGVKEIVRVHLSETEQAAFNRSIALLKEYDNKLKI